MGGLAHHILRQLAGDPDRRFSRWRVRYPTDQQADLCVVARGRQRLDMAYNAFYILSLVAVAVALSVCFGAAIGLLVE